uniref:3,4-dihydroxy-2-butanone 4-phosphate synthase n=1 Tax=Candidatus Aschnera chinzeii TaxID=1485666 RepID=A0AAT9G4S8_9ENTR|nr:MAG: 3,4-dihydroxy-2-butanone-4-phosphate synthase [Candidatus Aschnera chinzeii]
MHSILYFKYGTPNDRIEKACESLKRGEGVIILDDEERENEGDIIFAAETITINQMAFTIRYGSGIVCLCINEKRRKQLALPMMVKKNTNKFQTPFTVSIEAALGITTGVSAHDRVITIRTAIKDHAKPTDLSRPGHVFPLLAQSGGVLKRRGHTEATIDLITLAGFKPFGVLCELVNDDGSMARMQEIINFAQNYKMSVITIDDLVEYIRNN